MSETRPCTRGRLALAPLRRRLRKRWAQWREWARMARRLAPLVRRRRGRLLTAVACGVGYTVVGLAQPWPLKLILDTVILGHPLPASLAPLFGGLAGGGVRLLDALVVAIVLLALGRGLLYYFQRLLAAQVGQRAVADLRLELYGHIQRLCFRFHDRRRTGDMIARLTGDIRFLRDMFISLPITITGELFLFAGMLAVMFAMDWSLTLLALLSVPLIAMVLRTYQKPMRSAIRRQRDREGDIATIATETLGAIKVVQGFGREQHEIDRFSVTNKRSLRTGLKATRLEAKLRWYAEVAVALATAVVVGVAARRVLSGALLPGDLIVFVTYLRTFNRPLRRISRYAERSARGVAAGERVLEMLEVEATVRDHPDSVPAPRLRGEIAFEGVSFKHRRGPRVLDDVDLSIRAGERVALVGSTGAGKSTLVSLIPRFYDVSEGQVRLDGVDVRELTLESLRSQIALVFQEPVLFAATIAENIGYGKLGASPAEIVEAARRTGIHAIVEALPDGYETVIGERGGTLSGGQRQCIAIARAMIKDAPILILDEPTTGLDSQSSALVLAALDRLMEGRTAVMISHHLGSLRGADRVLVLEGGQIAQQGSHRALAASDGLYGRLSRLQVEALAS